MKTVQCAPVNVKAVNIKACNGIIHMIDKVPSDIVLLNCNLEDVCLLFFILLYMNSDYSKKSNPGAI